MFTVGVTANGNDYVLLDRTFQALTDLCAPTLPLTSYQFVRVLVEGLARRRLLPRPALSLQVARRIRTLGQPP